VAVSIPMEFTGNVQQCGKAAAETDAREVVRVATADPEVRLLIVDDELNIVELLSASMRFVGFKVVTATAGVKVFYLRSNSDIGEPPPRTVRGVGYLLRGPRP